MKFTEKLGLKKPELPDGVSIEDFNHNSDVLEGVVGGLSDEFKSHLAKKATEEELGHVKAGENITIDENGVIDVALNGLEPAQDLTLQNGWTGTLRYTKDKTGMVYVWASVPLNNGIRTRNTTIAIMPIGYRPKSPIEPKFVVTNSSGVSGVLRVSNINGSIAIESDTLEGIVSLFTIFMS